MLDRFGSAVAALLALLSSTAWAADSAAPNDNLNAVLWDQTSVEAQGNALAIYALGQMRLDQALMDKTWTAAPAEQTGAFADLPPAMILDVDDTVLNTAHYQAWNIKAGTNFTGATWTQYVKSQVDTAIAGAVAFTQVAAAKGVTVFYVSNRNMEEKPATLELMHRLGFAFKDGTDTFLAAKQQPDWTSAKGTRRAFIAKSYRILLAFGDNLGDFTDEYKGTLAQRQAVFVKNQAHFGLDWLVVANPTYGSFESAPYNSDYKLSVDEQRTMKRDALAAWGRPPAP